MSPSKRNKAAVVLLFLILCPVKAQDPPSSPRPSTMVHIYDGCPDNSLCSEETGKLRKQRVALLKESPKKALQSHGIPVGVWTTQKDYEKKNIVIWDSPCPNHKQEGKEIHDGEIFIKAFKELSKDQSLITDRVLVIEGDEKILYNIPRGELPLFVGNKKIYLQREIEGSYYAISIDQEGRTAVADLPQGSNFPEDITCPKGLGEAFSNTMRQDFLFQGYRCKKIWDHQKRLFVSMAYGQACS